MDIQLLDQPSNRLNLYTIKQYREGAIAYQLNKSLRDNIYKIGTWENFWWKEGFLRN